ncbi:DEAD/DEAH box helicase [Kaistia sp. MMO-174]|uniref:DEAD/DEAH box helicase n=1 Tax=Kaistia sp. MMO-174 TaxID=3081256 RepID=UPI00301AD657
MTIPEIDWRAINDLSGDRLKGQIFQVLQIASQAIQVEANDSPALLGIVPRLAELLERRPELSSFQEAYNALARSVGLWNYIDRAQADIRDELIAEAATVPALGIALHREQLSALNTLLNGNNLILSAPTSFGKSLLVDALLLTGRFNRIAIVLPTIALLDEFRRRLVGRFGSAFDVLMHHSEKQIQRKVIFLGTQERLINRDDLGFLDLVVVDEFYKLDPSRKDDRSVTLNAAVYKLLQKSKQFFFIGPNIDNVNISQDNRWTFQFLKTRFSTVAVDTFDLNGVKDKASRLSEEVYRESNWPALVFVSSPDRANKLSKELAEVNKAIGDGKDLALWMESNYGTGWSVTEAVAAGVGVHHGRVPRALASRLIRLFNDKKIPILICTSTLIEGVNTAAKSVLIYDKKINRADYDFFTFSNIRGRAGRLGQHHVGNVYLFHTPPGASDIEVTAPLFGDLDDAPDEFVVHIDEDDTTQAIDDRIADLVEKVGLSPQELRRFSSIGIETLAELRELVIGRLRGRAQIQWSARPNYEEICAVCEILSHAKRMNEFGVHSYKQLAMYLSKLRSASTIREFFMWHAGTFTGDPDKIDGVFKFLRAAEYSLPEYFAVIDLLIRREGGSSNYELFIAEMPRWFRAEPLKILEERGVPIQISERFLRKNDTVADLSGRLRSLALGADRRLSAIEQSWILDALPQPQI